MNVSLIKRSKTYTSTKTMSQIPQRKHSKDELANLRAQKAMQMAGQQVVNPYDKKLASKPVIILGYLFALVAPLYLMILKLQDKILYEMSDLKIMSIGSVIAILIAVFIFVSRSLSRHHGSFIIIIAMISSFSMVHLVKSNAELKREIMVMFGQEVSPVKSEADLILEESLKQETGTKQRVEVTKENLPKEERITLTPEERAEMDRMFKAAEERRAGELESARRAALRETEEARENSE